MKKAKKLHQQFSRASEGKLKKLWRIVDVDSYLYQCMDHCCTDCEHCQKYGKALLKPVVCLPLATNFKVVCMDLKEVDHENTWTLHLIDAADICVMSNCGKEPTVHNIIVTNKVVKKLKSDKSWLVFPGLGDSDATHA